MDLCLKSHWRWQLGALHNANRRGRKVLEEKHGRWKRCAEVPVAWRGAYSIKEKLCFPQPRLGSRKEEQCPQPFFAFGPLAVLRLTGRWSRPANPNVVHLPGRLPVPCMGISSPPSVSDRHVPSFKRSGCARVPELCPVDSGHPSRP